MKVQDLFEGVWVIKNIDGVEKRFKNKDSEAARAWSLTRGKKKALPTKKYTQTWWEAKEDRDFTAVMPWDKIEEDELSLEFILKSARVQRENLDNWGIQKRGEKKLTNESLQKLIDTSTPAGKELLAKLKSREDPPTVATATVRLSFVYTKEDDLGMDDDDDGVVEDAQNVIFWRNPENPKKLIFGGYTW